MATSETHTDPASYAAGRNDGLNDFLAAFKHLRAVSTVDGGVGVDAADVEDLVQRLLAPASPSDPQVP